MHPDAHDADLPHLTDSQVESLLRGHRPAGGPPGVGRTADVLHALTGPATPSELNGHRQAMAAYADTFAARAAGQRPRRLVLLSSLLGVRALAGAAGSALALGAVGAVVLTSTTLGPAHTPQSLPLGTGTTTTSSVTHSSDDAEDEDGTTDASGTATTGASGSATTAAGPDASGPAAFGLCNAWSHHQAKGRTTAPGRSVAFRNLAEVAGGEGRIAAYCAKVPHPGNPTAGDDSSEAEKDKAAKPSHPSKSPKPVKPSKAPKPSHPSKAPKPIEPSKPTS